MHNKYRLALYLCLLFGLSSPLFATSDVDNFKFDDTPLEDIIVYPDWFKQSFLDLDDDLKAAVDYMVSKAQ